MKRAKVTTPKTLSYVLIPQQSDIGAPMYELLYSIIDQHHQELSQTNVRVALAWCTSWKADVDGRLTLGKCKKASELDRELAPFDFVILLNRDFWQNPRVADVQRTALLDHELMHAAVAYDEHGDPKVDERGRTCYRIRKHDLEEFADIASRYGCWKRDIESFMQALTKSEHKLSSAWVGYTTLHEQLKSVGVDIPAAVIATWDDAERRDAMTWAVLRYDADVKPVKVAMSPTMPACLAAALKPPTPQASETSH